MSDASVCAALRSETPLVVIEAPAGCGKTHQGSEYAIDAVGGLPEHGRVLLLAHTHAACDVFSQRTPHLRHRVEVRTIDSLVVELAAAYHLPLGLPADPVTWARTRGHSYEQLAGKVAALLNAAPVIERMLARRYPLIICDEHQDANPGQHAIVMALRRGGAALRIFGDPMQRIYGTTTAKALATADAEWSALRAASVTDELETPHRWGTDPALGEWILAARTTLREGRALDLTGAVPASVRILPAESIAQNRRGYRVSRAERAPIDAVVASAARLLVLTLHNDTVLALRAFFNGRLPIWEGHVRDALDRLATTTQEHAGDPGTITEAAVAFLGEVCKGFSASTFGNVLVAEVRAGCTAARRGKPATLQALGRLLLAEPNHRGVAKLLRRVSVLMETDPLFADVRLDYRREFWDAVTLGDFATPDAGVAEISRRRTARHPAPPDRAISTIHKAKGLECEAVLLVPCDATTFPDTPAARRKLYVAMSRAAAALTFVVSRANRSPLFKI